MTGEPPFAQLQDEILDDPRFPEPVAILRVERLGSKLFKLTGLGRESDKVYRRVFRGDEIQSLRRWQPAERALAGDADLFRLAAEGSRIQLAHLHDPLFAVSLSRIDPLPHQLEAVYGRMLGLPSLRFMLADDPGAGKTIMGGLLHKELKLRGAVARTLIVAPSPLLTQWQREMREKFLERFTVIDRGLLDSQGTRRAWNTARQAIASMDFVKQPDILDSIANADKWDLVIVDEAHKMAAYRRGQDKIARSQRHRLGQVLAERAVRFLLMTATPHKGDTENFRLLLSLVDPDLFANQQILQEAGARQENPIFLRRLKEDMRQFDGQPLFPPRQAITVPYRLEGAELELYQRVTEYARHTFNRALAEENRHVSFALIVLQRRLASSLRAVGRSLRNRRERLLDLRDEVVNDPAALQKRPQDKLDFAADEDLTEAERWRLEREALRYTVARNLDELDAEIDQLADLRALAEATERSGPERKLAELRGLLHKLEREQPGEKLLIFTEARDTLDYLLEKLREQGIPAAWIHGGMKPAERVAAEAIFRSDRARVMVATEAAGEGINLQFCHLMINYDIPWNPTRLEQRLGRIHRYGQDRETYMYNLVASNTREGEVLEAVFHKLERMRQEMGGDRVYDVIGERLAEARLQDMIQDHLRGRRMFSDILASLERAMPAQSRRALEAASLSSLATRHINIPAMTSLRQKAKENRLSPAYIRGFFMDALETLYPGRVERRADGNWRIKYVPAPLRNPPPGIARRQDKPESSYRAFSFDLRQARQSGVDAMIPGHPLFDALLRDALLRCRGHLESGAIFHDPEGRRDGLIWLVEGTVNDGLDNIAGQQLFALYQPADGGEREAMPASVFLDLVAPKQAPRPPQRLLDMLATRHQALEWSVERQIEPYLSSLEKSRARETGISHHYLRRSFTAQIAESDARLMEYDERQARGQDMRIALEDETRRNDELRERRDERLARVLQQGRLSLGAPRMLGVAGVLPLPDAESTAMRRDDQVERAAVDFVMQHERAHGRQPRDRSAEKLPFDITSVAADGTSRAIEVKGRAGVGSVQLTENEWRTAENMGAEYWLYIVSQATTAPSLKIIRDPARALEGVVKRTRYQIPASAWQAAEDGR